MSRVAIIDYGSGNLRSAAKAFDRAARESGSDAEIVVTDDARVVAQADRIVLPGVGAFADCRRGLDAVPGMVEALTGAVIEHGRPFIGICVGMQLMATRGIEFNGAAGLDWIPGEVVPLQVDDPALKIPHMGWNDLGDLADHPVLAGIGPGDHAYFVHSFHLRAQVGGQILATARHGERFAAIVGRDNLVGTQFHPEKSQRVGLRLITNFLGWKP